jgi:D-sedoheptulose 7-phosphate isomerase
MTFTEQYLAEAAEIIARMDAGAIERAATLLAAVRERGGRLFILGVGGSAANASHAVNDFRKLAGIEAYAPTDNVSELTARTNDEGWASCFAGWLHVSRLRRDDGVLVLSVGGGDREKNVSPNLVAALEYAREVGARVVGVVGRDGGHTARVADACVVVATVNPAQVTPKVWVEAEGAPATASFHHGCGRVLYTTYHTQPTSEANAPLEPQALALLYLVLEVGVCIDAMTRSSRSRISAGRSSAPLSSITLASQPVIKYTPSACSGSTFRMERK